MQYLFRPWLRTDTLKLLPTFLVAKASHMAKININRMVKYILLIVDHDKGGGGKEEL